MAIATAPMAWMRTPEARDGEEVDEGLGAWKDRGQDVEAGLLPGAGSRPQGPPPARVHRLAMALTQVGDATVKGSFYGVHTGARVCVHACVLARAIGD